MALPADYAFDYSLDQLSYIYPKIIGNYYAL